ncbi:hypothetical protein GN156_33055 [bacterium LRH843]|nr:hypothetical protein [bacterium LRH843]
MGAAQLPGDGAVAVSVQRVRGDGGTAPVAALQSARHCHFGTGLAQTRLRGCQSRRLLQRTNRVEAGLQWCLRFE